MWWLRAVRALDNVIDLNFYALPYAKIDQPPLPQHRSRCQRISSYACQTADPWESEEHLAFVDDVFERINHAAIEASSDMPQKKAL